MKTQIRRGYTFKEIICNLFGHKKCDCVACYRNNFKWCIRCNNWVITSFPERNKK